MKGVSVPVVILKNETGYQTQGMQDLLNYRSLIHDQKVNFAVIDKNNNNTDLNEPAVKVEKATVQYHLPSEKITSFKEYCLRLAHGKLKYQNFFPIKNIDLEVKKGEAWGLVGVNGSGKSTLLKLVCGILKPYEGSVKVNGSIAPLIELGAGIDAELSGRENIYLNGCILGYSIKDIDEHFDEIVEFSQLGDFLDTPVKNYSSGMRARLGFSVATMIRPDILIVDEILAVGDYGFQQKCRQRMKDMKAKGTTLLFVSHNEKTVRKMCDHAMWLDHGNCKMKGTSEEVCDAYKESFKTTAQKPMFYFSEV